jgi:hypothetical protein
MNRIYGYRGMPAAGPHPKIRRRRYMVSPELFANFVRIKLRNVVSSSGPGSLPDLVSALFASD